MITISTWILIIPFYCSAEITDTAETTVTVKYENIKYESVSMFVNSTKLDNCVMLPASIKLTPYWLERK